MTAAAAAARTRSKHCRRGSRAGLLALLTVLLILVLAPQGGAARVLRSATPGSGGAGDGGPPVPDFWGHYVDFPPGGSGGPLTGDPDTPGGGGGGASGGASGGGDDDDVPMVIAPNPMLRTVLVEGGRVEVLTADMSYPGAGLGGGGDGKAYLYPADGGPPYRLAGTASYRCLPGFGSGALVDATGAVTPADEAGLSFDLLQLSELVVVAAAPHLRLAPPAGCDLGGGGDPVPPTGQGQPLGPATFTGPLEAMYGSAGEGVTVYVLHAPSPAGQQHVVYLDLGTPGGGGEPGSDALLAALSAALSASPGGVATAAGEVTASVEFGGGLRVSRMALKSVVPAGGSGGGVQPPTQGSGGGVVTFSGLLGAVAPPGGSGAPLAYVLQVGSVAGGGDGGVDGGGGGTTSLLPHLVYLDVGGDTALLAALAAASPGSPAIATGVVASSDVFLAGTGGGGSGSGGLRVTHLVVQVGGLVLQGVVAPEQ
mmetsp:Transcript_27947/g.82875  ORF Transcript_27947/g.82875 Transcript_27947/m.82875 type:complete len:482 (-) Transcript_27947:1110-2555(-)